MAMRVGANRLPRAIGYPKLILILTAGYLALGLAIFVYWLVSRNVQPLTQFFRVPGAILFVWLAATQLWFATRICRELVPGEPLEIAWRMIAISATCDLLGTICIQWLAADSPIDPLHYFHHSAGLEATIRECGLLLGGVCRFTPLCAGLFIVLRFYRIAGFLSRLTGFDLVLLLAFAGYLLGEGTELLMALSDGKRLGMREGLNLPVDPLLWLLLGEALLLYRSIQKTGMGLIPRCWAAFAAGIFLILLADVSLWAARIGYLPWPWSALEWYLWVPAEAAFALAPAYQFIAMEQASSRQAVPQTI
jgi:hypothetical protein